MASSVDWGVSLPRSRGWHAVGDAPSGQIQFEDMAAVRLTALSEDDLAAGCLFIKLTN